MCLFQPSFSTVTFPCYRLRLILTRESRFNDRSGNFCEARKHLYLENLKQRNGLKFHKVCVKTVHTVPYGIETRSGKNTLGNKIQAAEAKLLTRHTGCAQLNKNKL